MHIRTHAMSLAQVCISL